MNIELYRRLARAGVPGAGRIVQDWNPDQPRDPDGKFGGGVGGKAGRAAGGSTANAMKFPGRADLHVLAERSHQVAANVARPGSAQEKFHLEAAQFHGGKSREIMLAERGRQFASGERK